MIEETDIFWGKDWDQITLDDFEECRYVFTFMPEAEKPYFMGAYLHLSLTLQDFESSAFEMFYVPFVFGIGMKIDKGLKELARQTTKPFNQDQREVLVRYIDHCVEIGVDDERSTRLTTLALLGKEIPNR